MKPLVIYHAKCVDGFAAAWCFHHKDPNGFDFYPGMYNEPPPDVKGRVVYLVDFSYKRAVVEQMLQDAATVVLIDHHKTAIEDLRPLLDGADVTTVYEGIGSVSPEPRAANPRDRFGWFCSVKHSGAMLAWYYMFATNKEPPPMLEYVQDYDLWQFRLPLTKQVSAGIRALDFNFDVFDKLMSCTGLEVTEFAVGGAAILRKQTKDIQELLELTQRRVAIGEFTVPMANVPPMLASDAGHALCTQHPKAPFAATYYDTATHRVFSLRSEDTREGVSAVAKTFGGGGHRNAAGFRVERTHPLAQV